MYRQHNHLTAAIDPLCIRHNQLELFGKLREPAAGIPRCCNQDLGIPLASMGILVVYVRSWHCGVVIF